MVLVACEQSGIVRDAFAARGHDAWSCDLLPSDRPGNHYVCDASDALLQNWDLLIAHPHCTHTAVSGARYFAQKRADGRQQQGIDFFLLFVNATHIPRRAIEHPVSIMSSVYRPPDQIIQPWWFGHPESKATCLWLFGLPRLTPTNELPKRKRWDNQTASGQNRLGPSPERARIRAQTYAGIAAAMAEQWGAVK